MSRPYRLGIYEKALPPELGWAERLGRARSLGFDYLEISVDETDGRLGRLAWSVAECARVLSAQAESGLALESMCLSAHRRFPLGSSNPVHRAHALQIMERALELACRLGLRTIQLAGYDVYYEESTAATREWFSENLARCVEMASKAGVQLGFETMETPFMDTVAKAMGHVDRIDSPYLGVYPDIGNLTNASLIYGNSVADDIARGRGRILAAHVKEAAPGRYREVPFGTGSTDYDGALLELARQGVRRYVAECWFTGSPRWEDELAQAHDFVRARLDGAFAQVEGEISC